VEDHLRPVDVDCRTAVRAGQENLAFVRVQLTAALGAVDILTCDLWFQWINLSRQKASCVTIIADQEIYDTLQRLKKKRE